MSTVLTAAGMRQNRKAGVLQGMSPLDDRLEEDRCAMTVGC